MKTLRARIAGRLLGLVVATSLSLPAMAASEAGEPGKASGKRSGTTFCNASACSSTTKGWTVNSRSAAPVDEGAET